MKSTAINDIVERRLERMDSETRIMCVSAWLENLTLRELGAISMAITNKLAFTADVYVTKFNELENERKTINKTDE